MMKSFTHRQQGDRGEKLCRFSFREASDLIVIFFWIYWHGSNELLCYSAGTCSY